MDEGLDRRNRGASTRPDLHTPASSLPFTSSATTVSRSTYSRTPPTKPACTYTASTTAPGTSVSSHLPFSTRSHANGDSYPRPPSSCPPCIKESPSRKRSAAAGSGAARRPRLRHAHDHPRVRVVLRCSRAAPCQGDGSRTQCCICGMSGCSCFPSPMSGCHEDGRKILRRQGKPRALECLNRRSTCWYAAYTFIRQRALY